MQNPKDIKIRGGFVRPFKGRTVDEQEAALQAAGVRKVIRASEYPLDKAIKAFLRAPGDALAVSGGLRVLADTRLAILAEWEKFRPSCYIIIDVDTMERSDCDGIAMLHRAIAGKNAGVRMPDPEKAKISGAAGGRAKGVAYARGRMPKRAAMAIWRSDDFSTAEALSLMPGWSREVAYDKLGPRDVKPGRKPKAK